MTPAGRPQGLDHLGVFVSDLARARAFYEEVLAMTFVEEDQDEGFLMVTLRSEGYEVHLFQPKAAGVAPRFDHVAYRVGPGELEAAMRDLARRGVPFSGPHRGAGARFVKFKDPDGLTWELIRHDLPPVAP